ncbi:MAG: hypothetical protein AAGC70_08620, partial [Pseudomonadota bacterium]
GWVIAWRGLGAAAGFFIAMLLGKLDPRVVMMLGILLQTIAGYQLIGFALDIDRTGLAINMFAQGVSVGLVWVPMTVVTFWTLEQKYRAEGMAMFHLLRNFGSSLFISIAVAEIVRTASANYARLTEFTSLHNRAWSLPWATGRWSLEDAQAAASFGREINRQATLIGYTNAFVLFTVASAAMIPLVLLARLPKTTDTESANDPGETPENDNDELSKPDKT